MDDEILKAQRHWISRRDLLKLAGAAAALATLSQQAASALSPRFGGTFVVGAGTEPRHLNPDIVANLATKLVANPMSGVGNTIRSATTT